MFCTVKETVNRMKRQPVKWDKIFPNATNKGLIPPNIQTIVTIYTVFQRSPTDG